MSEQVMIEQVGFVRVGFFNRSPNNRSMMRLIVFIAAVTGALVAIIGAALVAVVVIDMVRGDSSGADALPQLLVMIGGGLGVIAGSEGFKALQQRGETKDQTSRN